MPISNQDLRKAGLKVTLPRIKILELLENSKQHHLSAEDIYKTLLGARGRCRTCDSLPCVNTI